MNTNSFEKNAVIALSTLLKEIKVKVTKQTIEKTLKNHPDFPSLAAMTTALDEWSVNNMAGSILVEEINEIPLPFIAFLQEDAGSFAVVRDFKNNIVEWFHTEKGWQSEKFDSFITNWTGIVLAAEATPESGEPDYTLKRRKEVFENLRLPFIMSSLALILLTILSIFPVNSSNSFGIYALLFTKLIGLGISVLLLWQSLDNQNPFVNKLCQINRHTNCDSILQSSAAYIKLGGLTISWSEVGFIYFASTSLGVIFSLTLGSSGVVHLLTLLSFTAIPYTLFSIFYQWRIARQWCVLCLSTQVILWLDVILILWQPSLKNEPIAITDISILGVSFLIPLAFWVFAKPLLMKAFQLESAVISLHKFKYNPDLFLKLLTIQPVAPIIYQNMGIIEMGVTNAPHTLIMVTNPLCTPCSIAHKKIENILAQTSLLKCQYIFTTGLSNITKQEQIANTILGASDPQEALTQWFKNINQSVEIWQRSFPSVYNIKEIESRFSAHKQWCQEAEIAATPTLFFDNHKLPGFYTVEDLEFIVKYLPENSLSING